MRQVAVRNGVWIWSFGQCLRKRPFYETPKRKKGNIGVSDWRPSRAAGAECRAATRINFPLQLMRAGVFIVLDRRTPSEGDPMEAKRIEESREYRQELPARAASIVRNANEATEKTREA